MRLLPQVEEYAPAVRRVPEDVRLAVRTSPTAALPRLVSFLVADARDDASRVRLLHDWVADNISYDVAAYRSGRFGSQSPADVVRDGRGVCAGFARLFETMCGLAGIRCSVVSGYARGVDFNVLADEDPSRPNHDWNAVLVGGAWRLVDVTWDAGHVRAEGFVRRFNLDYYMIGPGAFLFSHYPEDPRWQLRTRFLAADEFANQPLLRGKFFRLGLGLSSPLGRTNHVGTSLLLTLTAPRDVHVIASIARLVPPARAARIQTARNGNTLSCRIAVPDRSHWVVRLFARKGDESGEYAEVGEFGVVRDVGPEPVRRRSTIP